MFYEKLRKLCFERGISVSKMAVDLKISTTTVTGWKRGSTPQSAQVKRIAEFFGVSTDELTNDAEAAPADALTNGVTDLIDIIKSQQGTILNFSDSNKSQNKSIENISGTGKYLAESIKNFSESHKDLSASNKNLSVSIKRFSEFGGRTPSLRTSTLRAR